MSDPSFVYFGTTDYYDMIARNIRLLRRQYPDAPVAVYACGPTLLDSSAYQLDDRVEVIDWRNELPKTMDISRQYCAPRMHQMAIDLNSRHRGARKRFRKFFLKRFPNSSVSRAMYERVVGVENMILQKVVVLRDYSERSGDRPFIFLDADAFVAGRLDELGDGAPDLSVTLMPEKFHDDQIGHCLLLNVGVLYFGARPEKRKALCDEWYAATLETYEVWREQTALSRLLLSKSPDIMRFWNREQLAFADETLDVLIAPCDPFNFCTIQNDYKHRWSEVPEARVYHFANMAQNSDMFEEAMKGLAPRFSGLPDPSS